MFGSSEKSEQDRLKDSISDEELIEYGLNGVQTTALKSVLTSMPFGLVQGPPGTGKTKFIASLAHFALKTGLVSNVLLASQSHEAVNNMTESLLSLFKTSGKEPSLLRVGKDSFVSAPLLQYHSEKIEQLYKDRFKAELKLRLQNSSQSLGISEKILEKIIRMEEVIRPLVYKMRSSDEDPAKSTIELLEKCHKALDLNFDLGLLIDKDISLNKALYQLSLQINKAENCENQTSAKALGRFRQLADLSRDFVNTVSGEQRSFEPFLAGTREIVSGTCVGLGRPSLGLTSIVFDLVIIDEAARCTASELAVPLQSGRWIVLVGDHRQLEPMHRPGVIRQVQKQTGIPLSEIMKSDFERLFENQMGSTLDTQYRMMPAIGRIVSNTFYGSRLKPGRTETRIPKNVIPSVVEKQITWFDTSSLEEDGYEFRQKNSKSLINESEAEEIMSILSKMGESDKFIEFLSNQKSCKKHIGIICMYADQRDKISEMVKSNPLNSVLKKTIKVGTVDSYQGKENTFVLVSLVRNNLTSKSESKTIRQGFLKEPNRINVAMSRAMDRLVIVGSKQRWPIDSPLEKLGKSVDQEVKSGFAEVVRLKKSRNSKSKRGKNGQ